VTTPDASYSSQAASSARRARLDVLSLALLVLGAGGLLVLAFTTDWRLGLAGVFVLCIVAGVSLGLDREGDRL
jgi:ABC-type multidrug transport system fused ATPase/permease subunit